VPFGGLVGVLLVSRSFVALARRYALPTVIASIASAFAFIIPLKPAPGFYWNSFIACLSVSAIVFGLHARTIRWLVDRRAPPDAPP
jgi:hypothetical protein